MATGPASDQNSDLSVQSAAHDDAELTTDELDQVIGGATFASMNVIRTQ
jgi:bacteriocin-like protein